MGLSKKDSPKMTFQETEHSSDNNTPYGGGNVYARIAPFPEASSSLSAQFLKELRFLQGMNGELLDERKRIDPS